MIHVQLGCLFMFKLTIGKLASSGLRTLPKLSIACPVLQRAVFQQLFPTGSGKLPQEGRLGKSFGKDLKVEFWTRPRGVNSFTNHVLPALKRHALILRCFPEGKSRWLFAIVSQH